jgi:hypothetical protein
MKKLSAISLFSFLGRSASIPEPRKIHAPETSEPDHHMFDWDFA